MAAITLIEAARELINYNMPSEFNDFCETFSLDTEEFSSELDMENVRWWINHCETHEGMTDHIFYSILVIIVNLDL